MERKRKHSIAIRWTPGNFLREGNVLIGIRTGLFGQFNSFILYDIRKADLVGKELFSESIRKPRTWRLKRFISMEGEWECRGGQIDAFRPNERFSPELYGSQNTKPTRRFAGVGIDMAALHRYVRLNIEDGLDKPTQDEWTGQEHISTIFQTPRLSMYTACWETFRQDDVHYFMAGSLEQFCRLLRQAYMVFLSARGEAKLDSLRHISRLYLSKADMTHEQGEAAYCRLSLSSIDEFSSRMEEFLRPFIRECIWQRVGTEPEEG